MLSNPYKYRSTMSLANAVEQPIRHNHHIQMRLTEIIVCVNKSDAGNRFSGGARYLGHKLIGIQLTAPRIDRY